MRLTASDLITLHRPTPCELRVFLRNAGEPEEPPDEYDDVIRRLGRRHEQKHLQALGEHLDCSQIEFSQAVLRTIEAVEARIPIVYQPALETATLLNGIQTEIVGIPDFLILDSSGYVIRDAKMARRINEDDHPEILLQVQLYGWLFEKTFGAPPKRLEVFNGKGEVVPVPYDGGTAALDALANIVRLKRLGTEPYEPVGQSKCSGCGFGLRCWELAEQRRDPAIVMDVDQGLARQLHADGIISVSDLLAKHDLQTLSELKRPRGMKMARVGAAASKILMYAEALDGNSERVLTLPNIPNEPNFVMFDLEGLPPHLDELDKIYLWGIQVFGAKPSEYMPAVAGFGQDGDRDGWERFLQNCESVFGQYGDIRFVHWSAYEKTNINKYIQLHGDPNGTAARVLSNLLDLFPIAKESVILPVPSYGLKTIEQYVGFKRTQEEYGGTWSMATFIEATETQDEEKRNELMGEILLYNEEDLRATWAVMEWLRGKRLVVKSALP
jgi:predicted RecB family nuclease